MIFFILLISFPYFFDQNIDSIIEKRNRDKEKEIEVNVNFYGKFELKSGENLWETKIIYDKNAPKPKIEYEGGKLNIESELQEGIGFRNKCILKLNKKIPVKLKLNTFNADIDLTEIEVEKFIINSNGNLNIVINKPNKIECKEFAITMKAGRFTSNNLSNANFNNIYFNGSAGFYTLNLLGNFSGVKRAEIMIGAGKVTIILPKEAGVKVKSKGAKLTSNYRLNELEEGWQELNFNENKAFIIHINGSLSFVNIKFI